jgi:hypothetical protein
MFEIERTQKRRALNWLARLVVVAVPLLFLASGIRAVGKPEIDPSWVNGQLVYMIGPHLIVGANANLHDKAEELYLIVYPTDHADPTSPNFGKPLTLPSGYQPNCNPCFHPGLPPPFVYHDHVLTGAPGLGNNGTAGEFKAPWKVIVMMYNPAVLTKDFKPITSASDIDPAEAAGKMFVQLAPGAPNPYEIDTGNVLICPLVSPHA